MATCRQVFLLSLCFFTGLVCCEDEILEEGRNPEGVITISSENWRELNTGEWMVEFYAPWCPYCNQFAPVWKQFGEWAGDTDIRVGKVDVNQEPTLAGQFMIAQLPTILHIKDGEVREYTGEERTLKHLQRYIEEDQWSKVDPIPWYKSPTSLHMRLVGWLFQFSQHAQVLEEYLRKEYDLPTWGIFAVIAVATVMGGLLIGLLCVVLSEVISRMTHRQQPRTLRPQEHPLKPVGQERVDQKETNEEVAITKKTETEELSTRKRNTTATKNLE